MAETYLLKLNGEERLDFEFSRPEHRKETNELIKLSKRKSWVLEKLKDLCIRVGRGKGSPIYTIEGVPLLKVRNLHNEYIDEETDFVLKDWFEQNKKRIAIKKDDILLTSTGVGTIGKVDIIREDKEIGIDGHITIIRVKKENNPKYILYYLRSKLGQSQIERFTTGCTGQTELNYKHVENFNILIPKDRYEQDKIVKEIESYLDKSNMALKSYKENIIKLKNIMNDICMIRKKDFENCFILSADKMVDRIDCYFYHPEREYLQAELEKLKKRDIEIIKGEDLDIKKQIGKKFFEENKLNLLKYLDIGNTDKDLGDIKDLDEDILLNLPTRARQKVKINDILQPRPTGSMEGVVMVSKELDGQLASTGFIQIRPKNQEEAIILWTALKSDVVQKQMFYLQSGSIQPEITPNNFKKDVLIPIPKDSMRNKIIEDMQKDIKEARDNFKIYVENKQTARDKFLEILKE